MAEQNDSNGGGYGGGSTSLVCTPSPSDQVAILNNLISRVSDIERFLSQLVGADVQANNLSELATDLGNVLNGTIVLPATSWGGAGSSVPVPADFNGTVMSGNVITTWTNGVVSFEVTNSGGITTGGGSITKWAQVGILASGGAITSVDILSDTSNLVSTSSPTLTINESGLYLFTSTDVIGVNTTNAQYSLLQLYDASFSLPGQSTVAQAGYTTTGTTSGTKAARIGDGLITTIPTNNFDLTASISQTGGTWTHNMTVSIVKLSDSTF